jgi:hypothetical protein
MYQLVGIVRRVCTLETRDGQTSCLQMEIEESEPSYHLLGTLFVNAYSGHGRTAENGVLSLFSGSILVKIIRSEISWVSYSKLAKLTWASYKRCIREQHVSWLLRVDDAHFDLEPIIIQMVDIPLT